MTKPPSAAAVVRALSVLAVLFGVLGMHALGGISLIAPPAMSATHSSMAMAPGIDDQRGQVVSSMAVVHPHHWTCVNEHCVATMRTAVQLSVPGQFAAVSDVRSVPAALVSRRQGVMLRAPPHAVCLADVCVSRT